MHKKSGARVNHMPQTTCNMHTPLMHTAHDYSTRLMRNALDVFKYFTYHMHGTRHAQLAA
eukprot:2379330-Lingulodinium_polyedra.AAC.1